MSVSVAEKLFTIYGVVGERLNALLEMTKGARSRGWLRGFRGVVPHWFEDLVLLERDASSMQEVATRVVPGILQTEDYARAVLQGGIVGLDVDSLVQARLARAEVLDRPLPPEYWVVLCESVLQCQIGGRDVMGLQLDHLVEQAQRPNITMQVLPNSHGAHPSMNNPFTILGFDLAPDFSVVYMDYLTGSLYRDDPDEVAQYHRAYRHIIKAALPEDQSIEIIKVRMKELS
ncbi:MAG: transcriptional regulator [Corynebacteriales bacterium]|nr:transcriptional regulator [Mycobacteriales bacterium]